MLNTVKEDCCFIKVGCLIDSYTLPDVTRLIVRFRVYRKGYLKKEVSKDT